MAKLKTFVLYFVALPYMFLFGLVFLGKDCPYMQGKMIAPAATTTTSGTVTAETPEWVEKITPCVVQAQMIFDTSDPSNIWPLYLYGALIALPLLVLLFGFLSLFSGKPDFHVRNEDGMISVTQTAMRKFIRCICSTVPGIDSVTIDIENVRNQLVAKLSVCVATPDAWLAVRPELLERVPEAIKQVMGPDTIKSLEVVCADMRSDKLSTNQEYPTLLALPEKEAPADEPIAPKAPFSEISAEAEDAELDAESDSSQKL